ncbi:MAG TPA: 3'-5' exonuclease [Candidatus Binataceae bacterium]|nr:3'-5' exonuclease [Candidatus Binataceae bacterium]
MFAVFDIETRVDKRLLNHAMCAGEGLSDEDAFQQFRERLRARRGSDFFPLSLHIPISIAIGDVGADRVLRSVESLALADYSEEALAREFWARAERFPGCLVTFNGRRFDFPVLELAALRYGIAAPAHFAEGANSPRARYAGERHLDLFDYLTNFGASGPMRGGMDLLLKMIGLPGKMEIDGAQVQDLYDQGRLDEIHRYCRNDVVQTYFLFLRVELMRGRIDEAAYEHARRASAHFLDELVSHPVPAPEATPKPAPGASCAPGASSEPAPAGDAPPANGRRRESPT